MSPPPRLPEGHVSTLHNSSRQHQSVSMTVTAMAAILTHQERISSPAALAHRGHAGHELARSTAREPRCMALVDSTACPSEHNATTRLLLPNRPIGGVRGTRDVERRLFPLAVPCHRPTHPTLSVLHNKGFCADDLRLPSHAHRCGIVAMYPPRLGPLQGRSCVPVTRQLSRPSPSAAILICRSRVLSMLDRRMQACPRISRSVGTGRWCLRTTIRLISNIRTGSRRLLTVWPYAEDPLKKLPMYTTRLAPSMLVSHDRA